MVCENERKYDNKNNKNEIHDGESWVLILEYEWWSCNEKYGSVKEPVKVIYVIVNDFMMNFEIIWDEWFEMHNNFTDNYGNYKNCNKWK